MTFKEMVDEVQANLGLEDIVPLDETIYAGAKVNQGVVDLLARTRCVVRCIDLNVTADEDTYTLDHSILALVGVGDGLYRVNRDSAYQPSFTLIRSDIFRLQPAPSEDGQLQVWAVLRPSPMTADNHSPSDEAHGAIPDEFQDAIVTYALWKCADYSDDASSQMGERFRMLYEGQDGRGGRLAQIRAQVNKRGTSRPPKRRVRGLRIVQAPGSWTG